MIVTWLFVAAAVLGQTTQPADQPTGPDPAAPAPGQTFAPAPADPGSAAEPIRPRIRVVVPSTQPVPLSEPVHVEPTTQPMTTAAPGQLTGDIVSIQTTDRGVFIRGNPQDIAFIKSIIGALEEHAPARFQIFPLTNTTATDLAASLQRLWDQAKSVGGRVPPEDRVTVIPETRSNSLMVATAEQNMAEVANLIKELDQSPGGTVNFVPIQLYHIKAAEAEKAIQDLLSTLQKQRKLDTLLVNIKPDIRTNRLLVAAPEADLQMVEHLVKLIDVEPTVEMGTVAKMAIFPLMKGVATEMAKSLTDMLQANTEAGKIAQEQIRKLQVILRERDGEKALPDLDLEKPIKILADTGTNSVIIQSTESNLRAIGELIKIMDTVPMGEDMIVKIFPLKYAEADALRANLQQMFTDGPKLTQEPNQQTVGREPKDVMGNALVHNIGLSADKRTNTLIVSGRPEQILLVNQVISSVDVAESANRFPVRKIDVKFADVTRIQQAIQELSKMRDQMAQRMGPMEQERERIVAIPDERTKSIIVIAKDDNFAEVQDLVSKLDSESDKWEGEIHIISLQAPLMATDIADKVKAVWERRKAQRQTAKLPEDNPVLVADTRSNAVVVAANPEDFASISRLIGQLQQLPLSPMQDIREYVLKHNDATKLESIINGIFDKRLANSTAQGQQAQPADKVAVMAEPLTNTLLIASSKTMYEEVVRLIAQLDAQPQLEGTIRTFFIKNIDATQAATMLTDLFKTGVYRGPGPQQVPEAQKNVTIIPDIRSNALIISGSPENLALVDSILKDVDRVEVPVFQADTRVIPLHNADVTQVADQLKQLMDGLRTALGTQGQQFQLTIIPNAKSNSLILSGSRLAMKRAEEVVPALDQVSDRAAYETKVYKLTQGSASQLEPLLTNLFEKRLPSTEKQRTPIVIIPDDTANSLIVSAPRDTQQEIGRIIEQIDKPTQLAQRMEIIRLEQAKATTVADALQNLIKAQQSKGGGQAAFSVTAESRTNSLIVLAPPDLMATVQDLVRRLDTTEPKEVMALRVFRLENAEAENLSKELDDFFKQASTADGKELRQLIIRFNPVNSETGLPVLEPATGERVIKTLVHQDITIRPDKYTNSLMVLAPADSIDMMEMLVKMLDSLEPRTAQVKAFDLRNADAEEMRKLLQDLFKNTGSSSQGGGRSLVLTGGEGGGAAGAAAAGGGTGTGGTGGESEVLFAVDRRTNTLVAAGSPPQLKIVESLVYRLDDQEIDDRVVRVVPLQYAKAADVAQTMSAFFKSEQSVMQKVSTGESASLELQRQVTIESSPADSNTNTLLISYSPKLESQVVTMVNELDRPPPQVMIQVLMAEVTLDDRFELGMEFALQDLLFSEKAYLGNNGVVKGPGFDFIGGTDLGAAGSGLGGVSFTVTGADFNYLVRALQVEGRLEVLSRPALLVQDNKEASIDVGESVPVVQDLVVSGNGTVTPSVNYKDVGVMLKVTPIINPDGFVNLKINPEISALGVSSVSIGAGVTLPIFTQRKADTNVTVKDGETIVIGGLITSSTNESENKVPVIGDIPLVGLAFRATVRTQSKTELLMVLTPHVVRNPDEARTMSIQMRDQTGMMDTVRSSPLMQGLQVKPGDDQLGPDELHPRAPEPSEGPIEQMGPDVEELGPPTTSIEFGPSRNSLAIAR